MRSPVILRVFKDSNLVEVKQFDADQIVIGRQAEVQLDLPDEKVSPIHCMIELRDAGYYVCDLGSQGGTFKNGQAVLDEALSSGDEILVGPYRIVFFVGVPKPKTVPVPVATPPGTEAPSGRPQTDEPVVVAPVVAIPAAKPPAEKVEIPKAKPVEVAPTPVVTTNEAKKQNKSAFVAPVKPALRASGAGTQFSKKKQGPTFAPSGDGADLRDHLKPGKGNVVEVVVAWQDRVLETFHFNKRGTYKVGPTDRDPIRVASNSIPRNWTLLDIGSAVKVNVSDAMTFELASTSQNRRTMEECLSTGKAQRQGTGTSIRLDQNEMVCISLGEDSLLLFIRFVPSAPIVPMLSPLGLTGAELSGLATALVLTGLLAFYISATTPKDLNETPQEEVTRTAQIIFNAPPPKPPAPPPPEQKPPPPPPEQKPPPPPPPDKAKVADAQKDAAKKGQATNTAAKANEKAGQAAEVAPIPNSQNRPKKFTSTKSGGAVKLGQTAGANANSAKDMSKVGLFSAFGGGGVRSKLDQAYSGSGEVLGQADKATGTSGFNENRAGDDLGSKFKDTGAGGKGTATQGIAGIGTKGRGSGQAAYGASDGLGAKTSVAVEAGGAEEDFIGTIDREAVRRRVRHYLHEIRGCYNRELNKVEKGQRLEGKVVISWEIIAKGAARNVRVKSSTLGNANVENCIRERLASWSFPEPPVGMTAEVSFPFYLRPEN